MTPDELNRICRRTNRGMSPRWHRVFAVSYRRSKAGLPSNYHDFTWREKVYAQTGLILPLSCWLSILALGIVCTLLAVAYR